MKKLMGCTDYIADFTSSYGLEFAHPQYLDYAWVLLPLVLIAVLARRRARAGRLAAALFFRAIVVLLLVLALAGAGRREEESRPPTVVAAVDVSGSMGEEGRRWAADSARSLLASAGAEGDRGVILFARGSEMSSGPARAVCAGAFDTTLRGDRTDVSSALRLASIAFPGEGPHRLLLFSDGNENSGDALSVVRRELGGRFRIDCFAPPQREGEEDSTIGFKRLDVPQEVDVSEEFTIRVLVENGGKDRLRATLKVLDGQREIRQWPVDVHAGTNELELEYRFSSPGPHRITACLSGEDGAPLPGGVATLSEPVFVNGPPKVLCVSATDEGRKFLSDALASSDIDVRVAAPEGLPGRLDDLLSYECVILSSVPASALKEGQMKMLELYVRDHGGGLVVLGGEDSFGPEGYRGTPVGAAIPVEADRYVPFVRETEARLCIILVLDMSGSMRGKKLGDLKEAARALVERLCPRDMVGIITFDSDYEVVVPLGFVGERAPDIIKRIERIKAGGGTRMAAPLEEALEQMAPTHGRKRHVILVSDGFSMDAPLPRRRSCRSRRRRDIYDYDDLSSNYRWRRVSMSTIGVGRKTNDRLLRSLARMTGGSYYHLSATSRLTMTILQDTRPYIVKSAHIEKPIVPKIGKENDMLAGIAAADLPTLLGYAVTAAKARADTILYTDVRGARDPLLAAWRYGLGKAVAFTSDADARWSAEMVGWRMFRKFWTQVLRWAMREPARSHYTVRVTSSPPPKEITLETFSPAGEGTSYRIVLAGRSRKHARVVKLDQVAPRLYCGTLAALPAGTGSVVVERVCGGRVEERKAVPLLPRDPRQEPPLEMSRLRTNDALLQKIARATGGSVNPAQGELSFSPMVAHRRVDLTRWLFPCMFVFLLTDIALRKLGL